jgi:thiazole/oxazole-forming peptide maturase SagD family component
MREAGIEVDPDMISVDPSTLGASLVDALNERVAGAAPVLVLMQGPEGLARHLLMPVPGCACTATASAGGNEEPLAALLDPLFGIAQPERVARRDVEPSLCCDAVLGPVRVPAGERPTRALGWGLDPDRAAASFVGEAVERYAAFRAAPSMLRTARVIDVPGGLAMLNGLSGFDEGQRRGTPYVDPADRDELAWVEGRALADGASRWVPAATVYLRRAPGEPAFAPMQSVGMAAHSDRDAAASHARLEVLERAALSLGWHRRHLGRRLSATVLAGEGRALLAAIRGRGRAVSLCLASDDGAVPVVVALISGEGYPWICFGSAARLSVVDAARAALGEAALQWDHPPREAPPDSVLPPVAAPRQHFLVHANPVGRERWLRAVAQAPEATHADALAECTAAQVVRELLAIAPLAVEVDATPPDVAAQGYTVHKVVAPGVPFLQFGRLGSARRTLTALGLQPREDIHPYA